MARAAGRCVGAAMARAAGRYARVASRCVRAAGSRASAALTLAALAVACTGSPAAAQPFTTQEQALAEAFPGARIERRAFVLTDAEAEAIEARARVRINSRLATAYAAWHGDTLAGTAFFDRRIVRTMPAVLMVVVAPDSTVRRVDILGFHEPPDYRPPGRWLALFDRRRLGDGLWPQRDIRNLSGSTLSARAVTESVRLALALYQAIAAPALAGGPAPIKPR